jgi:hypothetical protein
MQVVVSIVIMGVYISLVAFHRPYRAKRDNTLALTIYSVLTITLFCGLLLKVKDPTLTTLSLAHSTLTPTLSHSLLLKVKDGYESTGKYSDGFTVTTITVMLVSSVFFVVTAAVTLTVHDMRRMLNEPLLRFKGNGRVVMLPALEQYQNFDLFLSHAQDLGQDQVATIKAELVNLLPGMTPRFVLATLTTPLYLC